MKLINPQTLRLLALQIAHDSGRTHFKVVSKSLHARMEQALVEELKKVIRDHPYGKRLT